jgi:hypothetical protein
MSLSEIFETGNEVAPSPSAQSGQQSISMDCLGVESLHLFGASVEIGGAELCVARDLGRAENGGESAHPGERPGFYCIRSSTKRLESAPPETGTAGSYHCAPRASEHVGNGGEGIHSPDTAPAWRALASAATSDPAGQQAARPKLGGHFAAEENCGAEEAYPDSAVLGAPMPKEGDRGRAPNYEEVAELDQATEQVVRALVRMGYNLGKTARQLVPVDRGEPAGEHEERCRDWEVVQPAPAAKGACARNSRSEYEHQRGELTGSSERSAMRAMGECWEERVRRWRASGGSAGGASAAENDSSHSTPKGCAEDTGVLQCVMR